MRRLGAPTLAEVEAAAARLRGVAVRTPLVPLQLETEAPIFLKLECLQPIGSFKLRGAANALAVAAEAGTDLRPGVYTASAGNMAQGLAWTARRLGVPCAVVVPETAPQTKVAVIRRLGATLEPVSFDAWWQTMVDRRYPGFEDRLFVHPVADPAVLAGNGTIGLEILDDLPEVETIVVPFGGGGLSSGIAAAVAARKPGVRVVAAEVETAAPLAASLRAARPMKIDHRPSFVDGIGGKSVLAQMWPLVSRLLDGSAVVSLAAVAQAIRLLLERHRVLAEGAGAAAVAAAIGGAARGPTVAVVSGGNLDLAKLAVILRGGVP